MNIDTSGYEDLRFVDSLVAYVEERRPIGHFLTAVLENDLQAAFAHGDELSIQELPRMVKFVYNRLPGNCWGSPARVKEWYQQENSD